MLTIQQIQQTVAAYFKDKPVKKVYLFGSYARGEATEDSDVDLLVEYNNGAKRVSFYDTIEYRIELEAVLKLSVELVSENAVYERFLTYIQKDRIKIYEA